jgi:hypothetical protein
MGRMGSGKTSLVIRKIKEYLDSTELTGRVIYLDPQGGIKERIEKTLGKNYANRIECIWIKPSNEKKVLEYVCNAELTNNCLIVCDDMRAVAGWWENDFMNLPISWRHRKLKIVYVFHNFNDVYTQLWRYLDDVYLFGMEVNPKAIKKDVPEFYTESDLAKIRELKQFEYIHRKISSFTASA